MHNSFGFSEVEFHQKSSQQITVNPETKHWFAVYTRAHHEKTVADQLCGKRIEHFLPLYTSVRRWKDRLKTLSLPLFPGYLFVRITPAEMLDVLKAHGVARLVGAPRPISVESKEIERLQLCLSLPLAIEPHPYLHIGQRVRVRRGPLTDLEGILLRKKNYLRLVVSVELIQRSVAVEVDAADIVPINSPPPAELWNPSLKSHVCVPAARQGYPGPVSS